MSVRLFMIYKRFWLMADKVIILIKRLDDLELAKERKAQRLGQPVKNRIFLEDRQKIRWSHFKNLTDAEEVLRVVRDRAFPFIKNLVSINYCF